MPILIILIIVGLTLFLQRVIYRKNWDKGLDAKVSFSDYYLFEGSTTNLIEVMSNAKILPLPWVHLKFQILRNGKSDNLFRSDIFNICSHPPCGNGAKLLHTNYHFYCKPGLQKSQRGIRHLIRTFSRMWQQFPPEAHTSPYQKPIPPIPHTRTIRYCFCPDRDLIYNPCTFPDMS